ncbi:MAG: hypothetical protein L6Q95_18370, partial [Planctomycetes bacterium]|nr:hypothetical protein [Planctomycetota bacterium]
MSDARRRKGTGSVFSRGGSFHCRWRKDGETIDRKAGDTEDAAEAVLETVDVLVRRGGLPLMEAIDRALGQDAAEALVPKPFRAETVLPQAAAKPDGLAFSSLLDLYLAARKRAGDLKPRTLQTAEERIRILKAAPWASRPVGSFSRRDV